jgi:hypothetical protein
MALLGTYDPSVFIDDDSDLRLRHQNHPTEML